MLPWEYGIRNLFRRPWRTCLTLSAMVMVVLLVLVVVGFIRGLERSLATSGDPNVALVYSVNSEENLESSSIPAQTPNLLAASVPGIVRRYGVVHASPEMFLGTRIGLQNAPAGLGLVRGVGPAAPLVRRSVRLVRGAWPQAGEVLVGRLVAAKIGVPAEQLTVGDWLEFEGRAWRISGLFAADGTALESEVWCNLEDLQAATQRQDLSLVAVLLTPDASAGALQLFCKERTDLELRALDETEYYASLQQHYRPVRLLAWLVVWLISASGIFAGLNMMYGAVAGRVRELASLQAMGFRRIAIVASLVQEGLLLSATGSLIAACLAVTIMHGFAVRFTMGAFSLEIDSVTLLVGCGVGFSLGILGALPPALKVLNMPVAAGLKAL